MITKKQVEHIAHLARLKLSEKEKEKFSKELSQILDFVEKLKEVETKNVEPFVFEEIKNILREDEIKIKNQKDRKAGVPTRVGTTKIKNLLEAAPEKENNYIKTKKIFEQ